MAGKSMAGRLILNRRIYPALKPQTRQYQQQNVLCAGVYRTSFSHRDEKERDQSRTGLDFHSSYPVITSASLGMLSGANSFRWHSTTTTTTKRSKSISTKDIRRKMDHEANILRGRAAEGARKSAKAARRGARSAGEMIKQYGPVFVGTYMGFYFATWASLFAGIDSGLIDPVTLIQYFHWGQSEVTAESKSTVDVVVHMLEKYPFTKDYAEVVQRNPHAANLAVSWVATKFTEPVRLVLTIGTVPRIAKWFGRELPVHDDDEGHAKSDEEPTSTK